uniref:Retrovirus-related Pol polyprotein from transposon TNT 1-94 n=1 Tax=Tanacetum cinerariifolium TaxID=118510 RepID=A0A699GT76_TANCI|nr:retrovirus-related Pol polyprotein from transposon TNT 1-94 [Tanacetum cinerariifolium]
MHRFWNSVYKHDTFYRFKIAKKKRFKLTLEVFRDIIQIFPRVPGINFDALPFKEDTVSFLRELGHTGEINSLNDVVFDQMHQPWRTFAALINRGLSGKTSSLDKLRLSRAQILWESSKIYGAILPECLTSLAMKESKACTTYLGYATGAVPSKIARKFKKASPSKKDSDLVHVDEEPVTKGKRVKRSIKKFSTKLASGFIIKEPHMETKSRRKEKVDVTRGKGIELLAEVALTEEAQMKKVRKKSLRDFHKTHPGGSSTVAKRQPRVDKITPTVTSEGTDDSNEDNDSENEGNDEENKSDDDKTPSDSEKRSDSEQYMDRSKSDSESDQQEYEEEVKDDDDDKSEGDEDRGMDDTAKQFNAYVTIATVAKETEVPDASVSHSSDLESKFLNFSDIHPNDAEIVSPLDVYVHHEVPRIRTSTLLMVPVLIIPEASPIYVAELKKDPLHTQVTTLVDDHLDTRIGATREEFMNFLSASLTNRITEQVRNQLPQILPEEVSNFAPPAIKKMIEGSLNQVNLAKASSQPQSTYEAAATLTEIELKKILIDKMKTSESYLTAPIRNAMIIKMNQGKRLPLDMIGISHWEAQHKTFYAYARGMQSRGDVYSTKHILAVTHVSVMRKHGYGYLEEIVVRRVDNVLYRFKEGDDVTDFAIALRMFTRSLVIQKKRHPYTPYKDPQGFIYVDDYKRNRLMRSDELYKEYAAHWKRKELIYDQGHQQAAKGKKDDEEFGEIYWWDILLDSIVVLRCEKRSKSDNKGRVPTEMELVLEQTQQGSSYAVSASTEGVKELKRKVKIKGEKKEALHTLKAETGSIHILSETISCCLVLKTVVMDPVTQCTTLPSHSSDKVLKLKNLKKDTTLKLSSYHVKNSMSMLVQKSQDHKMGRLQDDAKRLCLVDDLKKLKITFMKNMTLQEMSRTMLNDQSLPQKFWCNAVDTSTYILNRILIRAILGKTPYKLLRGRKPTLDYFRVFRSKCFILNTKDYLTKFNPKSYEGVFLGYSQNSKAYIILNKHTRKVEESLNMIFDENPPPSKTSPLVDDDLDEQEAVKVTKKKNLKNDIDDENIEIDEIVNITESRNHPLENNMKIIGTKWVFINKLDENGIVSRNKARLVAQGYNQKEGIDYDETYAVVDRLESIMILLAYACTLYFKLFQMDVKSAFLNCFNNEEVYVAQPPGFIDFEKPVHVYKLKKALYGLKQAPKAWPDSMFSVCLCARLQEAPKTSHLGLWYPKGNGIERVVYADSDHAGDYVDRKRTSGICTFVGCCLTSWFSKKQTTLAISTTGAEYVSTEMACQQALWMKQSLIDYEFRLDDVPIMCDNKGAIDLSKTRVIMPRKSSDDYKNTRHYIPMISHEYYSPIKERLRNLKSRYIHEGQVVFEDFVNLNYVRSLFHFLEFEYLLEINDQICPRFILEFYSQYQIDYSDEGQLFIKFVIQNQFFSYSLEEFAQILDIPCEGACVFTDKWSLDKLAYGVPTDGPYQTNPPSPDDIISYIRIDREGQVRHIRHEEEIDVYDHQIITPEIVPTLKPLEEII